MLCTHQQGGERGRERVETTGWRRGKCTVHEENANWTQRRRRPLANALRHRGARARRGERQVVNFLHGFPE